MQVSNDSGVGKMNFSYRGGKHIESNAKERNKFF